MHNVTLMSDFASVLCNAFWKDNIYLDLRLLLLQCCLLK